MNPLTPSESIRRRALKTLGTLCAATVWMAPTVHAQTAEEFRQLKEQVERMQATIDAQSARIAELEKARGAQPGSQAVPEIATNAPTSMLTMQKLAAGQDVGTRSPVAHRRALNDRQEAVARPLDHTLDPTYRGFIPIPNTPALIRFSAKPRLDVTSDNQNAGSPFWFVPAEFPLRTDADYGGGEQSSLNANATQLGLDMRAPELPGNLRFYYQNDFFGSDTENMQYRLQHLYGQFHGVKAGYTDGVWTDPDSYPDTVDYEGPNAQTYSRRPVAHYTVAWNAHWNTTFGIEQPDIQVDVDSGGNTNATQFTRLPDFGLNTRYEKEGLGHLQFSALFRDLGARDDAGNEQTVFGWGVNLSAVLEAGRRDSLQLLGVYGRGVGGLGNDTSFLDSDAAYTSSGELMALPYWSFMAGYTHHWSEAFRSTVSYGYVSLDNASGQSPDFYRRSDYASLNVIWQVRRHLSLGLEGLYGYKEADNGVNSGDHWRIQVGLAYSIN